MHIDALIHTFRLLDIADILIVAVGIYYLYKLLKDTRAVSLLKGLVMLAILNLLSHLLNLYVINWILQQSMTVLLFALPVVFQPELRRALEQLGRGRIFSKAQNVNCLLYTSRCVSETACAVVLAMNHNFEGFVNS